MSAGLSPPVVLIAPTTVQQRRITTIEPCKCQFLFTSSE